MFCCRQSTLWSTSILFSPWLTYLYIAIPPYNFRLVSSDERVVRNVQRLYPETVTKATDFPVDFEVEVKGGLGLHRFIHRQARFLCEGHEPFQPLPAQHSYAMLEWGLNYVVAANEFTYAIVHAGILALNDNAIMFPAPPGSGKSTLTLWLAFHGWRLLSDEMALVKPNSLDVVPFVRPICLKNKSIELAKAWFPHAVMSDITRNTHKGDVCHVSPPLHSWQNNRREARLSAIVFPKYQAGSALEIYQLNQAQAFAELANNAFNMSVLGKLGFDTAFKLVSSLPAFTVQYSNMDELTQFLLELVADD